MKVVVAVDMQEDFVDGSLGTKEAQAIVPIVIEIIEDTVMRGTAVVFTQDTHGKDYLKTAEGRALPVKHCIVDTPGWQIVPELQKFLTYDGVQVVRKPTFGDLELFEAIENERNLQPDYEGEIDEADIVIELLGLCTDICVVSNAIILKTKYPEATVRVHSAACAGTTPEAHDAALAVMKSCQIEIL